MTEQEKKRKKSIICLTSKVRQKISEIIGISLWPLPSPYVNSRNCAMRLDFENKTNATSLLNIDSLKTAIKEKWYKHPVEFILKEYKSFSRRINITIEKK